MSHNASKILMGSTQSTYKKGATAYASDPATYLAGLAVRRTSGGLLSTTKSAGGLIGVSLGKSLSDHKKTTVLPKGLRVPILLESAPARGVVVITDYTKLVDTADDTLQIGATTFTFKTVASLSTDVLCAASGSSNAVVAAALAAKINAHGTAGVLFKAVVTDTAEVTITAKDNTTLGEDIDLIYTDSSPTTVGLTVDDITFTGGGLEPDYVTLGEPVYISDTTGKADDASSGATITNAVYASGVLTGIQEDGTEVYAALIDMAGGF